MAAAAELNIARKKLMDALGDDSKPYFSALKQWFRRKISKEDFDNESKKFLSTENIPLHNEFLLAVLNKCQCWTSTHVNKEANSSTHSLCKDKLKKGRVKKKSRPIRATFEHRFQPVNPLLCVPAVVAKDYYEEGRVAFCVREATMPDRAMIHGRMFVTAWDCGLDAVDDEAVCLVLAAVEQHLKSIVMAVLSRRHAYKLREGRFVHAVGAVLPNPYTMNSSLFGDPTVESTATDVSNNGEHVPSIRWTSDKVETEAMQILSCGPFDVPILAPVSLFDVHEALQVRRNVIASHSIYAVNMERIATRLWHPSHEELMQDHLHQQEDEVKQQLVSNGPVT